MSRDNVIIEREILIAASPETIFAFLVDPMLMAQWFSRNHTLEPRPGGMFCVQVSLGPLPAGYSPRSCHIARWHSLGAGNSKTRHWRH